MKDLMGIINLSEREDDIREITYNRPIAAIPIAGRYRVIDFMLSNMVNAGIENILIFTQGKSRSLINHLRTGKEWDLDRKRDGLFILDPAMNAHSYNIGEGDVENFRSYIEYIRQSRQKYVVITKSYMVYNIDLKAVYKYHRETDSDITIVYKKLKDSDNRFSNCDTLNLDVDNRVLSIGRKVEREENCNLSTEMYILKKELLLEIIENSIFMGNNRYLKQAILSSLDRLNVNAYPFDGYISCINSIRNYFKTNMELLDIDKYNQLFYENGLIYTRVKDEPPTKYKQNATVINSLVANGCIIDGTVKNSIIERKVLIKKGAIVENSIIMQGCIVEEGVSLKNVILDKNVHITKNKVLHGDTESPIVIRKNVKL